MKKYVIECDKCRSEFDEKLGYRMQIDRLQKTRDPGMEADLCPRCRDSVVEFLSLKNFVIPTEKGPINVGRVDFQQGPPTKLTQVPTDDLQPQKLPQVPSGEELLPDERRDVKEILAKMDLAARASRKHKSPSEVLASKFEGGNPAAVDGDCSHNNTVVIDKGEGYSQCLECGRNLVNGREMS